MYMCKCTLSFGEVGLLRVKINNHQPHSVTAFDILEPETDCAEKGNDND